MTAANFKYNPPKNLENHIINRLAELSLDYKKQLAFIRKEKQRGVDWAPAAVLVLMGKYARKKDSNKEYFFLLNKRSDRVQQPGDLCFPGGHPNRWIDPVLSRTVLPFVWFAKNGSGFNMLRQRKRETIRSVVYFLVNGLRESFEEIRINPLNVKFLGALNAYQLDLFQRVIFPIVGIMKTDAKTKPNWEVERVIKIPLSALLSPQNYAVYRLAVTGRFKPIYQTDRVDYDCFIHREKGRKDEILWGASYRIVQSFLNVVFDFAPPEQHLRPIIEDALYPTIA